MRAGVSLAEIPLSAPSSLFVMCSLSCGVRHRNKSGNGCRECGLSESEDSPPPGRRMELCMKRYCGTQWNELELTQGHEGRTRACGLLFALYGLLWLASCTADCSR